MSAINQCGDLCKQVIKIVLAKFLFFCLYSEIYRLNRDRAVPISSWFHDRK